MTEISTADLLKLQQWDTPTICNGLELINPDHRNHGFTIDPFVCLNPTQTPLIGYAKTATIRARTPSTHADYKTLRLNYYQYIASAAAPSIVVIQDLDDKPGIGAFWGEVNTSIHLGLGVAGCVTNGSMRDLPDAAPGFQLLAGNVGPSHAHVHVNSFAEPVTVHDMSVKDGDIIHMDQHGAVVVPPDAVTELPGAIAKIARKEAIIIGAARSEGFNFDKLKEAFASAEQTD